MSKNKKSNKRLIVIIIVIVLVAAFAVGLWMFVQYRSDQRTVEVVPVSQIADSYWGDVNQSSGQITSNYLQEIYPDSSKTVSDIFVTEGQEVQIGDPLLQYDKEQLELDVQIKTVALTQSNLNIENAQKQLKKLQNTKPASTSRPALNPTRRPGTTPTPRPVRPTSGPTAAPTPTPVPPATVTLYSQLDLSSVPYDGIGTTEDPYVFLCTNDCLVTPEFLKWLLGYDAEPTPTPTPEPETSPEPPESSDVESDVSSSLPEGETTPEPSLTPAPSPTPAGSKLRSPFAAVFEVRDGNSNFGRLISAFQLDGTQLSANFLPAGSLSSYNTLSSIATLFGATPTPAPTANANNYNDMGYTSSQLTELINQKKQEIRELQLSRKQAQLDLDKANLLLKNSTVLSTVDGVVRTLTDQETAAAENKPFLVVSGDNTYYVSGALPESMLGSVQVGNAVTVIDYMSGSEYAAQIVSISDYPLDADSGFSYYGSGNPNSSNYGFSAVIDQSDTLENLQNGQYVDITLNPESENDEDTLYVQKAYVRDDEAGSYVMKAGIDNRLVKQYVQVGRTIYGGSSIEIKSGLTIDDYVAFPYGKDVEEGVRVVVQGSEDEPVISEGDLPTLDTESALDTGSAVDSGTDASSVYSVPVEDGEYTDDAGSISVGSGVAVE